MIDGVCGLASFCSQTNKWNKRSVIHPVEPFTHIHCLPLPANNKNVDQSAALPLLVWILIHSSEGTYIETAVLLWIILDFSFIPSTLLSCQSIVWWLLIYADSFRVGVFFYLPFAFLIYSQQAAMRTIFTRRNTI